MMTFLPEPDFRLSLQRLDTRRLGNQRREAVTLLRALRRGNMGWYEHPACKMWHGYELALALYLNLSIQEWVLRGHRNRMELEPIPAVNCIEMPWWLGKMLLHESHRRNLMHKDPKFYGRYGWPETKEMRALVWPKGSRHPGQFTKVEKGATTL